MSDIDTFDLKGIERFSLNARNVVNSGYKTALSNNFREYLPIHLFYALIKDQNPLVVSMLEKHDIHIPDTVDSVNLYIKNLQLNKNSTSGAGTKPSAIFSNVTKKILNESLAVASDLGDVYIGPEHILLAFFRIPDVDFLKDLKSLNLDYEVLKNTLANINPFSNNIVEGKGAKQAQEERTKALPYFCVNMNERALEGRYANITGRDEEIERLIHILSRKTKNNPILVGEAGVGKTAIVEGLVNMIVRSKVPSSFMTKRILNLDVAGILSGARLRGDVEERIISIINEASQDEDVIIFIDEIHNIVGAGAAGQKDTMDIANILKPYLTGSELSVIGATTIDEYQKYFEGDSALSRRFQAIKVEELAPESAKKVIYQIKKDFENYHKVKIADEAIDGAVDLTKKFVTDRFLPDKAIDVIDEAAATLKIGREIAIEPELSSLGDKLMRVQEKKAKSLENNDLEKAAKLKGEEDNIVKQIEEVIIGKKKVAKKYSKTVTMPLIRDIVYRATKIPLVNNDISDKTLRDLKTNIKKRIVGQDHVVSNVATVIQKSHLGLNSPNRPLASMLFLGPTGVGKTELAKALAKELFGTSEAIFQLNMSEFMEMHSVAKLIGAPPGYVGFQEGGQLTTFVKKYPYSVVLFDELEKAHPDTLNILLQILEEGELTDGKGNKVSFKNAVIIMTSNIGAEDVATDQKLGFDVAPVEEDKPEIEQAFEEMKDKIMENLRLAVRPEFLNRIDLIEVFRGLNKEDSLEITKIEVEALKLRLLENRVILTVDEKVVSKINEEGYSKEYGGRNIRRKVQEKVENGLAQFLIDSKISRGNSMVSIHAFLKKDTICFKFAK